MEKAGFRVAAGKCIGVEFTNTPFHTVKLNYVLLRLGVLCQLDYISPPGQREASAWRGDGSTFQKKGREKKKK